MKKIRELINEIYKTRNELKDVKRKYKAMCKIINIANKYGLRMTRSENSSGQKCINIYGFWEE